MPEFLSQLEALMREARAHPNKFGQGVRLLFSCRTRDMTRALAEAGKDGLDARGVGRMHILIERNDITPDDRWVKSDGRRIAGYFDRIDGIDPQIAVDRGAMA